MWRGRPRPRTAARGKNEGVIPTGAAFQEKGGISRRESIVLARTHFFSPAVKFVITVTDWLTCCDTTFKRIFFPSGETS